MTWSLWIIASVLLFVVEIVTPGVFFFACLGLGALVAGLVVLISSSLWLPWLVFVGISLLSMYFIRPVARNLLRAGNHRTNVDSLIGRTALVVEPVQPPNLGMVRIEGELWRAESTDPLAANETVVVTSITGTRLIVARGRPAAGEQLVS
jgi:membrane protein implicated in regulation of membrane protease activity